MKAVKNFVATRRWAIAFLAVALSVGTASTALAANGQSFILGSTNNVATLLTRLTANINNPTLQLVNTSTGTASTALRLTTATNKPPMSVNSSTKVTNLNADKVDGQDAEALLPGGVLPSGRTLRGTWDLEAYAETAGVQVASDSISFGGYQLAEIPNYEFLFGDTPTTNCPGSVSSPAAAKGYLCIYIQNESNLQDNSPSIARRSYYGAAVFGTSRLAGYVTNAGGTWAVTAP